MGCGSSAPSTLSAPSASSPLASPNRQRKPEALFNHRNKNNNSAAAASVVGAELDLKSLKNSSDSSVGMSAASEESNGENNNSTTSSQPALPADRKMTRKFTLNSFDLEKDLPAAESNNNDQNYVHELKLNSTEDRDGYVDGPKVRVSYATEVGFAPYSRKVNQDSLLIATELNNEDGVDLYGVFDGHGEFGHLVSRFVAEKLPIYVESELANANAPDASLGKAVWKLCEALKRSTIRTTYSGTTATFALRDRDMLYVGNLGDSRAVLGSKTEESENLVAIELSRDHKPDLPEERQRILASGGRVETLRGPPGTDCGPYRVWLAKVDVPGLAMSRSIGDDVAHSVGVSTEVEVITHKLSKNDKFMILASDGVWEFISSQEAVDLVSSNSDNMDQAVQKLVKRAQEQWRKYEQVVDDITAVIITFSASASSGSEETQE
eukprot:TRINITY_DN6826_c0_g3_i1.p1 TRINITY_DN6826_c0_g3~~TRINITY_DN6826_c0_g3_i1.p1  ORF type:complete len:437 (+),score=142.77 TRINITY_DN6826_c0_g3_i1:1584-2894(+)